MAFLRAYFTSPAPALPRPKIEPQAVRHETGLIHVHPGAEAMLRQRVPPVRSIWRRTECAHDLVRTAAPTGNDLVHAAPLAEVSVSLHGRHRKDRRLGRRQEPSADLMPVPRLAVRRDETLHAHLGRAPIRRVAKAPAGKRRIRRNVPAGLVAAI